MLDCLVTVGETADVVDVVFRVTDDSDVVGDVDGLVELVEGGGGGEEGGGGVVVWLVDDEGGPVANCSGT